MNSSVLGLVRDRRGFGRLVGGLSLGGLVIAGLSGVGFGCATPEVMIKNPIVTGAALAPTRIAKPHNYAESANGLPPGSMTDEAILDALDAQQVCVTVTLHELAAIDLNTAKINFASSPGPTVPPSITAEPPIAQTYNGLVPHRVQTGTREECSYRNGQSVCETRPIYSTTMVPGPVQVFATRGRLCAPNEKLVTDQTKKVTLNVSLPTHTPGGGMWGFGGGSKDIDFTWGFELAKK